MAKVTLTTLFLLLSMGSISKAETVYLDVDSNVPSNTRSLQECIEGGLPSLGLTLSRQEPTDVIIGVRHIKFGRDGNAMSVVMIHWSHKAATLITGVAPDEDMTNGAVCSEIAVRLIMFMENMRLLDNDSST